MHYMVSSRSSVWTDDDHCGGCPVRAKTGGASAIPHVVHSITSFASMINYLSMAKGTDKATDSKDVNSKSLRNRIVRKADNAVRKPAPTLRGRSGPGSAAST